MRKVDVECGLKSLQDSWYRDWKISNFDRTRTRRQEYLGHAKDFKGSLVTQVGIVRWYVHLPSFQTQLERASLAGTKPRSMKIAYLILDWPSSTCTVDSMKALVSGFSIHTVWNVS